MINTRNNFKNSLYNKKAKNQSDNSLKYWNNSAKILILANKIFIICKIVLSNFKKI